VALTSVLLIGQYFIERHFSRGYGQQGRARMKLRGLTAEQGGKGEVVT
jgi:polar amino acid transport system permease protein